MISSIWHFLSMAWKIAHTFSLRFSPTISGTPSTTMFEFFYDMKISVGTLWGGRSVLHTCMKYSLGGREVVALSITRLPVGQLDGHPI